MSRDETITELVELVLMQEKELRKLKRRIVQLKQYIAIYEEYLEGMDR